MSTHNRWSLPERVTSPTTRPGTLGEDKHAPASMPSRTSRRRGRGRGPGRALGIEDALARTSSLADKSPRKAVYPSASTMMPPGTPVEGAPGRMSRRPATTMRPRPLAGFPMALATKP
jgi:hypothetical protein